MSAHMVSKFDIDLLVRAAIHGGSPGERFSWWRVDEAGGYAGWNEIDEFAEQRQGDDHRQYVTPSQTGQILVSENVRSVHGRYPDTDPDQGDLPGPIDAYYMGPYVYENPGYTLTPGEVFATIDYLTYQSCEHAEWEQSEAYSFLRSLRHRYCMKVDGYDAAPWGWDSPESLGPTRYLEFSRRLI